MLFDVEQDELPLIVYSLQCTNGHDFEGWFTRIAAYEEQAAGGKLVCPVCASREVIKAPMAPSLPVAVGERNRKPQPAAPVPHRAPQMPDELRKMRQFMSGLRKYVEQNAENVGPEFPDEARKIHYGESEERPIFGEASLEEAVELAEEGIDVAPLPPDVDEAMN